MGSNKKIDLVILSGGKGSRISKYLGSDPKPLYKYNKIPFLQHLLNYFHKYPFSNTYILAGYKGNKIFKLYNNKVINLVKIKCLVEKSPLGTGGALKSLKNLIKNDFILVNGDSILLHNYNFIFNDNFKTNKNYIFLINNNNYKSNSKLANLSLSKKKIVRFDTKKKLMNAGVYFFKKNILTDKLIKKKCSLENDLIPKLIIKKNIYGILSKSPFIDIGTPTNIKKAKNFLKIHLCKKAAFFDRDGVIIHDNGYVHKTKNIKFLNNVFKSLKYLIRQNFHIFIVTNQAGIAKKKFTEKQFFYFQNYMKLLFAKNNINIDDIQFCPYHRNALIPKYKKITNMRKPGNGMIKLIEKKFLIIKKKSFFIGDQKKDFLAAKKSKLYFEYIKLNMYEQVRRLINY